jgi:hypothetical protein
MSKLEEQNKQKETTIAKIRNALRKKSEDDYQAEKQRIGTIPKNHKGVIDGMDNLYLAGQWIFPDGGLPVAMPAGKFAIQRIIKQENKIN